MVKAWVTCVGPVLALASCAPQARLEVTDVWMRETIGAPTSGAVFMTIRSAAGDKLVGASSDIAKRTDLMTMVGGSSAMKMEYVKGIDLPAGTPVSLDPAGLHVWLEGLNRPLKAGEQVPLTLRFERAGEQLVAAQVIGAAAPPPKS